MWATREMIGGPSAWAEPAIPVWLWAANQHRRSSRTRGRGGWASVLFGRR